LIEIYLKLKKDYDIPNSDRYLFLISCAINDCKSYDKIYRIKKRSYSKPLVIMVESFDWLKKNTVLNSKQIEFLKNYKKPFSILTNSDHLKAWLNYRDEETVFVNKDQYKRVAFRVANNSIQKNLIKKVWPIFLTSANLSNKPEIYELEKLEEQFQYYIDKKKIEILGIKDLDKNVPPSDIFEFAWDSLDIEYLRKN